MNDALSWIALPWIVAAAVAMLWCMVVVRSRQGASGSTARVDGFGARSDDADRATRTSANARRNETLVQMLGLAVAGMVWFGGGRPGLAVAILAPWTAVVLLARRQRQERERVAEEISALEAISAASRALRAGIPMSGILSMLATEGRGAAGRSFREIVRRESLGEDLGSALRRVLLVSPVAALRAFGLALLVHSDAGGNLADSTDRLARSLIERNRVRRRARTITSYGRAAGMLLSVMPVLVLALLCVAVEGYKEFVFERREGNLFVGISAILVMVGILSMQRIFRIERVTEGVTQ
ncbi:MAG: type II secretion system F family protein [bacterium]